MGWYDKRGHRHSQSMGKGGTRRQAEAFKRQKDTNLNSQIWVEPVRMGWDDYWEEFIADPDFLTRSASHQRLQTHCAKLFKGLVRPRYLTNLTSDDIMLYRRARFNQDGCGAATVNQDLRMIRAWLNRAVQMKLIVANPALDVQFLKQPPRKPPNTITWEQYYRLRKACTPMDRRFSNARRYRQLRFLMDLLWYTGMSSGDALLLTTTAFDLGQWTLVIHRQKTSRTWSVPLPSDPWFRLRLRRYLAVSDGKRAGVLFPKWGLRSMRRAWTNAATKAGLTVTRHDFRRSYISGLAMNGTPMSVVKELVGHQSIQTTQQHYTNVTPALRDGANSRSRPSTPARPAS